MCSPPVAEVRELSVVGSAPGILVAASAAASASTSAPAPAASSAPSSPATTCTAKATATLPSAAVGPGAYAKAAVDRARAEATEAQAVITCLVHTRRQAESPASQAGICKTKARATGTAAASALRALAPRFVVAGRGQSAASTAVYQKGFLCVTGFEAPGADISDLERGLRVVRRLSLRGTHRGILESLLGRSGLG